MQEETHQIASDRIARRVRGNAGGAALAAVCLLFFGFYYLGPQTGNDLFHLAGNVLVWTLRVGGIAMALLALWSLTGHLPALAVDGIVSVAIGVLLALTGIGMFIDGGGLAKPVINCVCAWLFIGAGMRNWREYRLFSGKEARLFDDQSPPYDSRFQERYDQSQTAPPPASLASQLRDRAEAQAGGVVGGADGLAAPASGPIAIEGADDGPRTKREPSLSQRDLEHVEGSADQGGEENAPEEAPPPAISLEGPDDTSDEYPGDRPADDEPPPEGFLSSFADEDSPRGL